MRAPFVVSLLALAALAPACGDGSPAPPRNEPKVKLQLRDPADLAVVRAESVSISGSVAPAGAHVQVLGREVAVSGGTFSADVALEPGANLIDVEASARGRRPDFAATRIVREVRVPIPDLVGSDADTAQNQLETLGLNVTRESGGGFLEPILPGDPKVCESRPKSGTQVLPGSDVTIVTARQC
jgi:hypothetical protein